MTNPNVIGRPANHRGQKSPSQLHMPARDSPSQRAGGTGRLQTPRYGPRSCLTTHFKVGSLQETRDCRQAGLLSHRVAEARDSGMGTREGWGWAAFCPTSLELASKPLCVRSRSLQGRARTLTESLQGLPVLCPGKLCGSNGRVAEDRAPGPSAADPGHSTVVTAATHQLSRYSL